LGSVWAVLPGASPPERVGQVLESVRHVLMARNGRAVIVAAPPHLAGHLDMATRHDLF
jgi:glycolate oxidase FAD binding subunit